MFDFLESSKVNLDLQLDRRELVYAPGDMVEASVTVENAKEQKINGLYFDITCVEEYEYREQHYRRGNSMVEFERASKVVKEYRHDFLTETTLPPGVHTYCTSINLSPDSLPTCSREIIKLTWRARATLNRKRFPPFPEYSEVEFKVSHPTLLNPSSAGEYGQSSEPDQAQMIFSLPTKEFVNTSPLVGRLTVFPKRDVKVNSIRLELIKWEYVPDVNHTGYDNLMSSTKSKLILAEKMILKADQRLELPFQLPLTKKNGPSVQLTVGSAGYKLKAILDIPICKDVYIETDVKIYGE